MGSNQDKNICVICGEPYLYDEARKRFYCRCCGYIKPRERTGEEESLLFAAAQKLRLADFDGASSAYEDICKQFPDSAEGYWGRTLAEYGIKYEDDYDGKKVPTCYSARYELFFENPYFKRAVQLADKEQRDYYQSQAKVIERIRAEWVEKASQQKPYDVFISFRDKIDGVRTNDSNDAYDLYNTLTKAGYRVFFSRVTLQDKTGENYEPYIFAALNSAPVMLLYASDPAYVTSTWIKNEWTRFLKRIRDHQKGQDALGIIVKGFEPAELPPELRNRQVLFREDISFIENLKIYVNKVVSAARAQTPTIERKEIALAKKKGQKPIEAVKTEAASSITKRQSDVVMEQIARRQLGDIALPHLSANDENKLRQADLYHAKHQYERALSLYEEVLQSDARNPRAMVGALLSSNQIDSVSDYIKVELPKLDRFESIIQIIDFSSKDVSLPFLEGLAVLCVDAFNKTDYKKATYIYDSIAKYDVPVVNALHRDVLSVASERLPEGGALDIIKLSLPYVSVDREFYQKTLVVLANTCISKNAYDDASYFIQQYERYFEHSVETYMLLLKARYKKITDESLLSKLAKDNDYEAFSGQLPLDENNISLLFDHLAAFALAMISNEPESANSMVRFLLPYSFPFREEFIEKGISLCLEQPSERTAKVLDGFLHAYGDKDFKKFISIQDNFARRCMEIDAFDLAKQYYDRLVEYDPDTLDHYRQRTLVQCGCLVDALPQFIHKLNDFSDIVSMVALRGKNKIFPLLYKPFIQACIDAPDISLVFDTFDTLCTFVPQEENDELADCLRTMATLCQKRELYNDGARYYALATALLPHDHALYWAVLQCKIGCKDENGLIQQMTPLASFAEFEDAKLATAEDTAALDHYIDVETKQIEWMQGENERLENIRKEEEATKARIARQKKKRKAFGIVSAVALGALAIGTALVLCANYVFIPESKYSNAQALVQSGDYDSAISLLSGLNGYKDSDNQVKFVSAMKDLSRGNYETAIDSIISAGGAANVAYDTDGGAPIPSVVIKKSKYIGEVASKNGYFFEGWTVKDYSFHDSNYRCEITLKAQWSLVSYSITYDLGGGLFNGSPQAQYNTETPGFTLESPVRAGYTFSGWTGSNGASPECVVSIPLGSFGDRHYTANWIANQYVVTFDPAGGEMSQLQYSYFYDTYVTLPLPSKQGYEFLGWYNGNEAVTDGVWKYSHDMTLNAKWSATTYKISYELDGGNVEGNPTTFTAEDTPLMLVSPTKEGYTFIGWTGSNGENPEENLIISSSEMSDLLYIANWRANTYQVVFDPNGGTVTPSSGAYVFDAPAALPTPTRSGYLFDGWYYGENKVANDEKWTVASDLTLIARWRLATFSISYDLDGGAVEGNPTSYTVETDPFALVNPTKTGYTFDGWTGSCGDLPQANVSIDTSVAAELSYAAHWSPNTYTVSFNANGGQVDAPKIDYTYGAPFVLPVPAREGYAFAGWRDTNGKLIADGIWNIDHDLTLFAAWNAITYYVYYELDGGTNNPANPATYTADSETIAIDNPTKTGYTFDGWTGSCGENPVKSPSISKGSHEDKTYIANWTANTYHVTFDCAGGEMETESVDVTFDSMANLPTPQKTHHTFTGWTYNGESVDASKWNISEDCQLVATWTLNSYELILDPGEGACTTSNITILAGQSFTLPIPTPPNDINPFGGWFVGETQITDENGKSLSPWPEIITGTTSVHAEYFNKIANAEELDNVRQELSASYRMVNDITLDSVWVPIGTADQRFTGSFYGQGHTVNNMTIELDASKGGYYYGGLFGYCDSASIRNISLGEDCGMELLNMADSNLGLHPIFGWLSGAARNCTIENIVNYSASVWLCIPGKQGKTVGHIQSKVGGIVAQGDGTTLSYCQNYGDINGYYAGGIMAQSQTSCTIAFCKNAGSVYSNGSRAGGIIGEMTCAQSGANGIYSCVNHGEIASSWAGGIVGLVQYDNPDIQEDAYPEIGVADCLNTGRLGNESYPFDQGGIVGRANAKISVVRCINCGEFYNSKTKPSAYTCAGIIGECVYKGSSIVDCYSAGNFVGVSGETVKVGPIINDESAEAVLENCFYSSTAKYLDETTCPWTCVSAEFIEDDSVDLTWFMNTLHLDSAKWDYDNCYQFDGRCVPIPKTDFA